ncbi:MAG: tetratricopeptide repeat protein [Rhodoferax sp.]
MKKKALFVSLAAAMAFCAGSAMAQEAAWQSSYQLEGAGKYADAIAAIDPVPANGPDAELRLLRRGWLYYLAGKHDDAIREYRLAAERNQRSVDARLGMVLPMLAAKRWRDADQAARAVLELAPNNYTAMVRLAIAQEGLQDWAGMVKTAAALVGSYPTDATSQVYLARANAWLGKRPDAVAAYTAVLMRYPGHLEAKAYIDKK